MPKFVIELPRGEYKTTDIARHLLLKYSDCVVTEHEDEDDGMPAQWAPGEREAFLLHLRKDLRSRLKDDKARLDPSVTVLMEAGKISMLSAFYLSKIPVAAQQHFLGAAQTMTSEAFRKYIQERINV